LENAIRTQAPIILEAPVWNGATINGFLISGDEEALLMEVTGRPVVKIPTLTGTACVVQMHGDQRYLFSSRITDTPQWGASRSIALARPCEMRAFERRRVPRTQLAPSSQVRLEWSCDGLARRCTAVILNISPDGLACRMDAPPADAVALGDILLARFALPRGDQTFALEATVVNKTPTEEGRVIAGLQFVRSQRSVDSLGMLRRALKCHPETATVEALA
jgi:hypothetical protein